MKTQGSCALIIPGLLQTTWPSWTASILVQGESWHPCSLQPAKGEPVHLFNF